MFIHEKYTVTKNEPMKIVTTVDPDIEYYEELEPGTYFVIREQDVFAPAALFGYAHLLQSSVELGTLPGRPSPFTPDEVIRLRDLADNLVELAAAWQKSPKKVCD